MFSLSIATQSDDGNNPVAEDDNDKEVDIETVKVEAEGGEEDEIQAEGGETFVFPVTKATIVF